MAHTRRHFLKAGAAAVALAAWPSLRRAFADSSLPNERPGDASDLAALSQAFERAHHQLRPLLVLIIPEDDGKKYERGHLLGTYLNHASDRQLAPLGQVEVVCAKMASVRAKLPAVGPGEPLMILLDPLSSKSRRIDPKLKTDPPYSPFRAMDTDARKRSEEAETQRIVGNLHTIAAAVAAALPPVPPTEVAALAAQAKAQLRVRPPRGSRWADGSGCGSIIEGEKDQLSPACGMGHVPELSRRFLYFFAPTPRHTKAG